MTDATKPRCAFCVEPTVHKVVNAVEVGAWGGDIIRKPQYGEVRTNTECTYQGESVPTK